MTEIQNNPNQAQSINLPANRPLPSAAPTDRATVNGVIYSILHEGDPDTINFNQIDNSLYTFDLSEEDFSVFDHIEVTPQSMKDANNQKAHTIAQNKLQQHTPEESKEYTSLPSFSSVEKKSTASAALKFGFQNINTKPSAAQIKAPRGPSSDPAKLAEEHINKNRQTMLNNIDLSKPKYKEFGKIDIPESAGKRLGEGEFKIVEAHTLQTDELSESKHSNLNKADRKLEKDVAVMKSKSNNIDDLGADIKVLTALRKNDPIGYKEFVPKVYYNGFKKGQLVAVTKKCSEGSAKSVFNNPKVPKEDKIYILSQYAKASAYLAKNGYANNDIGARNILVHFGSKGLRAQMADFGLTKKIDEPNQNPTNKVPVRWMAPEFLKDFQNGFPGNEKSDVFSLGITMLEAFAPSSSTLSKTSMQLLHEKNERTQGSEPLNEASKAELNNIHPDLVGLFNQCTYIDPDKRPTMARVQERLNMIFEELSSNKPGYIPGSSWAKGSHSRIDAKREEILTKIDSKKKLTKKDLNFFTSNPKQAEKLAQNIRNPIKEKEDRRRYRFLVKVGIKMGKTGNTNEALKVFNLAKHKKMDNKIKKRKGLSKTLEREKMLNKAIKHFRKIQSDEIISRRHTVT